MESIRNKYSMHVRRCPCKLCFIWSNFSLSAIVFPANNKRNKLSKNALSSPHTHTLTQLFMLICMVVVVSSFITIHPKVFFMSVIFLENAYINRHFNGKTFACAEFFFLLLLLMSWCACMCLANIQQKNLKKKPS